MVGAIEKLRGRLGGGKARIEDSRIPVYLAQCGQAARIMKMSDGILSNACVEKFFLAQFEAADIISRQSGVTFSKARGIARRMIGLFVDMDKDFLTREQRAWFSSPLIFSPRRPLGDFPVSEALDVMKMLMVRSGAREADMPFLVAAAEKRCRMEAKNQMRFSAGRFKEEDILSILLVHTGKFAGHYSPDFVDVALKNFFEKDMKNIASEERLITQNAIYLKKNPGNDEDGQTPAAPQPR